MPIRSAPNPNAFITPPLPDLFLVRITVVNSGTPDTYEFEEWHTTSTTSGLPGTTGPWEVKAGGRIGTSDNPGYAIPAADGTETTFAVDDFAWCRSAAGNAGLTWELVPISASGTLVDSFFEFAGGGSGHFLLNPPPATDTWYNTGTSGGALPSLALPSAGTYLLFGRFSGQAWLSSGNPEQLCVRLYDVTNAAPVSGTVTTVVGTDSDLSRHYGCGAFATIYTVANAATIRAEALATNLNGGTWSQAIIFSSSYSSNRMGSGWGYLRLTGAPGGSPVSVSSIDTGQATTMTGYLKGNGSTLSASSTVPTTDLSGTITNAQLAGSITFSNLVGTDINLDGGSA